MKQEIKKFNIRVYGICFNDRGQVLLSDEYVLDQYMTKFPGGGLKFGEGPEDCIKRESLEEMGEEIEIVDHFYTTGFFQKALFYTDHQLISIYYIIRFKSNPGFKISNKKFDFPEKINGSQSFRWADIHVLTNSDLSFPIDQFVLKKLQEKSF